MACGFTIAGEAVGNGMWVLRPAELIQRQKAMRDKGNRERFADRSLLVFSWLA